MEYSTLGWTLEQKNVGINGKTDGIKMKSRVNSKVPMLVSYF